MYGWDKELVSMVGEGEQEKWKEVGDGVRALLSGWKNSSTD